LVTRHRAPLPYSQRLQRPGSLLRLRPDRARPSVRRDRDCVAGL